MSFIFDFVLAPLPAHSSALFKFGAAQLLNVRTKVRFDNAYKDRRDRSRVESRTFWADVSA